MTKVPPEEPCPHCKGPVEIVGRGRFNKPIKRCRTCGREPGGPVKTAAAPTAHSVSGNIVSSPVRGFVVAAGSVCRVEGCPGTLDAAGACACCTERAAWVEANRPMRPCKLCRGQMVTTRKNREYCDACKKARNAVAAMGAKAKATK